MSCWWHLLVFYTVCIYYNDIYSVITLKYKSTHIRFFQIHKFTSQNAAFVFFNWSLKEIVVFYPNLFMFLGLFYQINLSLLLKSRLMVFGSLLHMISPLCHPQFAPNKALSLHRYYTWGREHTSPLSRSQSCLMPLSADVPLETLRVV